MHSFLHLSKQSSFKFYFNKLIIKTINFGFCNYNKKINSQKDLKIIENNSLKEEISNINLNIEQNLTNKPNDNDLNNDNNKSLENSKEEKTRKEEVMFYIMHDKFSVRPDKEYRIYHTTVESTDLKTKMKNLNVIQYGKNKIL